jgi:hypothetical protein
VKNILEGLLQILDLGCLVGQKVLDPPRQRCFRGGYLAIHGQYAFLSGESDPGNFKNHQTVKLSIPPNKVKPEGGSHGNCQAQNIKDASAKACRIPKQKFGPTRPGVFSGSDDLHMVFRVP